MMVVTIQTYKLVKSNEYIITGRPNIYSVQTISSSHLHPIGLIDIKTIVVIMICFLGTFIIIGLAVIAEGFHDGGVW